MCVWARRGLGTIILVIVFFLYRSIYGWHGHEAVETLADNQCSNDEVLRETFKTMKLYLDDVKGGSFKIFMLVTMITILSFTVLGGIYKVIGDKVATAPSAVEANKE